MASSKDRETIGREWRDLMNMAPQELEDWLDTDESQSVGDAEDGESTRHKSGRRIVTIMRTDKDDLTDDQWDHMAIVVGYIKRHCSQGGPNENVEACAWRYSSMNWGHVPLTEVGCLNG